MAIVVFNYAQWLARYPEFTTVAQASVEACFPEACLYCNNTNASPVTDLSMRTMFLNMLTAHIVALNFGLNGQSAPGVVGRISSAKEGSVSVSTEYKANEYAQWFLQTKYGASFWQASSQFRSFRYAPPPMFPRAFPLGEDC